MKVMKDTQSIAGQLCLDPVEAAAEITARIKEQVGQKLKRRGAIVAMSGGVDRSVCAALAVRALGAGRVFGPLMPEIKAEDDDVRQAASWAEELCIGHIVQTSLEFSRRVAPIEVATRLSGVSYRSSGPAGAARLGLGTTGSMKTGYRCSF